MIPIAKPLISDREKSATLKVLNSGLLSQGKWVARFEERFAQYIGTKQAVAVINGTAALHLTLLSLNIGPDDEVITTPFTFIASANCIRYTGARPIFVDVKRDTFNIDPDLIEKAITKKTKAILPVHLYGLMAEMEKIMKIAKNNQLLVIEDSCQAHGAEFKRRKAGSVADAGCFSFYPTKNMTTGEGGMITTNSRKMADRIKLWRHHGMGPRYHYRTLGFNFRMTDIAAAIGLEQLKKLEQFNRKRILNAKLLIEGLTGIPGLITPQSQPNYRHVFHQYTIRITKEFKYSRDQLVALLRRKGIGCEIYYPKPLHLQETFKGLGFKKGQFPVAEKLCQEVVSLPVHPSLSNQEINFIIKTIKMLA